MIETEIDDLSILHLLERYLRRITEREPNELIYRNRMPFFKRWYLARKAMVPLHGGPAAEREGLGGILVPSEIENLYVHHYLRCDQEDMHCHPWWNASLVVAGSYDERTPDGIFTRLPGDIIVRRPEQIHAIAAVKPGTITLFATAPKERDWGFHTDGGFVPWQEFHKKPKTLENAA